MNPVNLRNFNKLNYMWKSEKIYEKFGLFEAIFDFKNDNS